MSAHLTLEELTAHANGAPVAEESRAHLAACRHCQTELRGWTAVKEGVDLLVAGTRVPSRLIDATLAELDGRPARNRRRPLGRRLALASAAAAVLLGGAVYGMDTLSGPAAQPIGGTHGGTVLAAALADTDCPDLKVAAGVLETVQNDRLVLRTAKGTRVTVTISDSTRITRQVTGSLHDIGEGSHVIVQGTGSGGEVRAEHVAVAGRSIRLPKRLAGLGLGRMLADRGTAMGTVTDVHDGGFTVQVDGARVRVTTSASTEVIKQVDSRPGDLQKGEFTAVVGAPGSGSTLSGRAVQQGTAPRRLKVPKLPGLPTEPTGLPRDLPALEGRSPGKVPVPSFRGLGCDADTIATTALQNPQT